MTDNPMDAREVRQRTRQFYEKDASTYDSQRWTSAAGRYNSATQVDIVRTLVPDIRGPIAEIGTGTGRFSVVLADWVQKLILVDVSESMLKAARQRVSAAACVMGDICDLPLADDSIEGLVCLNVLSHVTPYDKAVSEIARVLQPDGWTLLNFNNLSSVYLLPGFIINRRRQALRADVFSQWIAWSSFRQALGRAGLCIVKAKGHMPLPVCTPNPIYRLLSLADTLIRDWPKIAPVPFILARKRGTASEPR
jgi:ubiquinone/menaquinone biosynthesis C-methylase UbiE